MSTLQPIPEDFERALAIAAHPDDLEYGIASAVARWTGQGKTVAYALATSGEAGIDGMDPSECGPRREQEERSGAAKVGVNDVEFLGLADGTVEYGLELRRLLTDAIRRVRPDIVVTNHFGYTWGDSNNVNHADHRALGLAVVDACRDAANRWLFTEAGEPWHTSGGVYVASTDRATHYVDVTGTIDAGVASLREHVAYLDGLGDHNFDPDEFLRGSAQGGGKAAGCELAVLFRKLEV
jgi:LmbE family N-acetylglucosaminyl deacetylase